MKTSQIEGIGTAENSRLVTLRSSSFCWKAMAFMTVASMPIWSPATRLPPALAMVTPRKMLPPPMTRPTLTPSLTAAATSSAIRPVTASSMPKA